MSKLRSVPKEPRPPMPSSVLLCILPALSEFEMNLPACVVLKKVVMVPRPEPLVKTVAQVATQDTQLKVTPALVIVVTAQAVQDMEATPKFKLKFRMARGKEPFDADDCEYIDSFELNGTHFHLFQVTEG